MKKTSIRNIAHEKQNRRRAKRGTRIPTALRIRDAALNRIRSDGGWAGVCPLGPTMQWQGEGLSILHRTPFQKLPPITDPILKQRSRITGGINLPYGLDIWDLDGVGKVLNIEWRDTGEFELVSFRRGEWESTVLAWEK